MRSLFSKLLLGWGVGTAPWINLRSRLKELEGNLVISRLSPTFRLLLGHPQTALLSFLKAFQEEESKKNLIFTQFS